MIALRNVLLFWLGVSIPLVMSVGLSCWLDGDYLSTFVVYALWAYVVVLFADGYYHLKRER